MNSPEEIYGVVSPDWELLTIGEMVDRGLASLQTGPFGTNLQASEYKTIGTPVIAVKNIGVNKILLDADIPRIDDKTVQRRKFHVDI
jgi:type I restriction enzyme S subunit